jgi:hypothetical protein
MLAREHEGMRMVIEGLNKVRYYHSSMDHDLARL